MNIFLEGDSMTVIQNASGDPPVERLDKMDFGATEPDLSHQWATSIQPRFALMLVQTQHIANLQRVLFNIEADKQMRVNALRQLQINVKDRDCEDSRAVLAQWQECGFTLE